MSYEQEVEAAARQHLVGKRIAAVRYMRADETEEGGWDERGVVIFLDDGTELVPMRDDEGNGPGAIATSLEGTVLETIAVVR